MGPWFHVYHPWEVSLLDGWPLAWEAIYCTDHFPTFAGNAPPKFGIAGALRHLLCPLPGSGALRLDGQRLLAIRDRRRGVLVLGRCGHLPPGAAPRCHRVGPPPSGRCWWSRRPCSCRMWRRGCAPADESLPVALWAAVVLIDDGPAGWRLAGAAGLLLLVSSLFYQYQWVLVRLAAMALTQHRLQRWRAAAVVGAAVCVRGRHRRARCPVPHGGRAADRMGLRRGPARRHNPRHCRARPLGGRRAGGATGTRSGRGAVSVVAGGARRRVGAALLGRRVALLALAGLAVSLASITYYPAPWAATNAYPIVYIGAGTACTRSGPWLRAHFAWPSRSGAAMGGWPAAVRRWDWSAPSFSPAAADLDLADNTDFLFSWWGYFAARYQF